MADAVGAVRIAAPLQGGAAGSRAGDQHDLVGDHEAGEQSDTELPDEVFPGGQLPHLLLRARPDAGKEAVYFLLGKSDAVVFENDLGRATGLRLNEVEPYGGGEVVVAALPCGDRIGGVL